MAVIQRCYLRKNEKKENDFWEVKLEEGIWKTELAIDVKKKRKKKTGVNVDSH